MRIMSGNDRLGTHTIRVVEDPKLRLTLEKWDLAERPGELLVLGDAGNPRLLEQATQETHLGG